MRIGVYFEQFEPLHIPKDPGQLVLGFNEAGIESLMVTLPKPALAEIGSEIPLLAVDQDRYSPGWWRILGLDYVVMYTWLSAQYVPLQRVVAAGGSKVVLKADIDGRTFFPSVPAITSAYAVVAESPAAGANLMHVLYGSGSTRVLQRLLIIPNPVSPEASRRPLVEKRRLIVSIGRWESQYQKNTPAVVTALVEFLEQFPDYEAVIIGSGREKVLELLGNAQNISPRVHVVGELSHREVVDLLAEARTFFSASRFEGFSIAATEAVSLGCTIVGPPLECFQYLALGGACGVLSPDWTSSSLVASLITDAFRWERGDYEYVSLANHWRKTLDRQAVAAAYKRALEQL